MRKLPLGLSLLLIALPAGAHNTKPTDVVSVESEVIKSDSEPGTSTNYSKPWSQIKVDASTEQKVNAGIVKLLKNEPSQHFRIIHLHIVNDRVLAVVLASEYGTTLAVDTHDAKICYTTVYSNGGIQSSCIK